MLKKQLSSWERSDEVIRWVREYAHRERVAAQDTE